jgi:flagellar protein FliO/FliZ
MAALAYVIAGNATAQAAAAPESIGATSLLQTTLGLALVLALIVAVAWIAKRFAPGSVRGGASLAIVASQAVGQRERVVVVEVGDQWLVVGVAPGHVSSLGMLPKGEAPPPVPASASFAGALSRALARKP